ncbi:hypothetical protein [Cetobacterium sp.]|uniref:hypothetical protein n=1 Tax=Cetobacterium sp. TaxID=2071632 RepID=UPI003F66EB3C
MAVVAVRIGLFDHVAVKELIFVADAIFSDKKAVDVIKIYSPRVIRVSWGAYCRIIIIHPMCAIDE